MRSWLTRLALLAASAPLVACGSSSDGSDAGRGSAGASGSGASGGVAGSGGAATGGTAGTGALGGMSGSGGASGSAGAGAGAGPSAAAIDGKQSSACNPQSDAAYQNPRRFTARPSADA